MSGIPDSTLSPGGPGLSAIASVYRWFVDLGSDVNRIFNPSPGRLAAPLGADERSQYDVASAEPIVLIGGYASTPESLEVLVRSLKGDGFRNVFIFEVPANGLADI